MQQPQSMLWKIAILIIALGSNVLCIRNANENDNAQISVKLKNFFPSEQLHSSAEATARISNGGGGFRPSQMLEFTPSDVMSSGVSRYPPSYLEPNYKHQFPSSLNKQQQAMDKQFSFPHEQSSSYELHTTPIVSYLDPYLQHKYAATPTTPSYAQYQREQPTQQGDQTYTVQSSLLVDSQAPAGGQEVYLKRPGYVFDESPNTFYRRPQSSTPATQTLAGAHKISYDSHDYPPPSYAAQQTSNFKPHYGLGMVTAKRPTQPPYNRQDIYEQRPLAASSIHGAASNYANNFGNYLQRPRPSYETPQQPPQQYQQPQRPAHNYYDYQIGEIPPQSSAAAQYQQQQFNYRPTPAASPAGGLATLASLFGSTQQYAPQFTNLLLGAATQSQSQSSSSPLGSLLGAFTAQQQPQQHQSHRPPNTQLIRALENIARNDDLQCVPKVLCQMIAGQTLRGQLPGFITSPAITNFLAGFPAASPALIYGRAALLGLSGGERSCVRSYEQCPKNEMEIIHYLNNHRGGFFKFFSEPEEQHTASVTQSESSGGAGGSFLSILSALTGGGQVTRTTPRPVPRPTQRPSTDIAGGIGSFFTQVLSEYLNGVEYQRRRRRSLLPTEIKRSIETDNDDFADAEDALDTQTPVKFLSDEESESAKAHTELIGVLQFPEESGEGRILHFKQLASEGAVRFPDATTEVESNSERQVIYEFNRAAAKRKLRFPQEQPDEVERQAKQLEGWAHVLPNGLTAADYGEYKRRGKRIVFEGNERELSNEVYAPPQRGARVIFPDHYERYIRKGKILNRPTYAPSYDYQQQKEDRFVLSNEHRPSSYLREALMNYGEYMPTSNIRFNEIDYNYPNGNYISDNRYSSSYQSSTRAPQHEDNKNIYVNNAQGVTEYYIRPDGHKVLLG